MTVQHRRVLAPRMASAAEEHLPLRPLWLCRRCELPWPCPEARLALAAEYRDSRVGLSLYLAGCLHDAIDDLHRLNPCAAGSIGDMYDRFLGWPARHTRSCAADNDHGRPG